MANSFIVRQPKNKAEEVESQHIQSVTNVQRLVHIMRASMEIAADKGS